MHYNTERYTVYRDFSLTESMLHCYLNKFHTGCVAGIDGVNAEHVIKWAKDTNVASVLCDMLMLCLQFGIIPVSFIKVPLILLLKKPNIAATVPKHY